MHVIGLSTWCGWCKLEQRRKQHFWLWRFKPQNTKLPPRVQINSLISLQLNYINLKGEKRITYLQEIEVNNQKCKLPLVRASRCLPTSLFVQGMIKKTKRKKKTKRWERKAKGQWPRARGRAAPEGCNPQCHTNRAAEAVVSQCWWGTISLESTWKSRGSGDAPASRSRIPLHEAHTGYSSSVVPLLLKISEQWGVHKCHCRFWGTFHENTKGSGRFQLIRLAG